MLYTDLDLLFSGAIWPVEWHPVIIEHDLDVIVLSDSTYKSGLVIFELPDEDFAADHVYDNVSRSYFDDLHIRNFVKLVNVVINDRNREIILHFLVFRQDHCIIVLKFLKRNLLRF